MTQTREHTVTQKIIDLISLRLQERIGILGAAQDIEALIHSHAQARERGIVEECCRIANEDMNHADFTEPQSHVESGECSIALAIRERFASLLKCRVCATAAAGLPTPGYIHDEACPRRKPRPSDRERLDWIEREKADLYTTVSGWNAIGGLVGRGSGATPRDAIDAAMKAEAEP